MQAIKIHNTFINAITQCLKLVLEQQKVADKELAIILKQNKNFGARDRSLIAESVYDIIRWKIKYDYQLSTLDANLNLYKHLLLVSLLNRNYEIKNPEIVDVSNEQIIALKKIIALPIAENSIEQSYPEEVYQYGFDSIGNDWHILAKALNQKAKIFIRINTLKCTKEKLITELDKLNIEYNLAIDVSYYNEIKNLDCIEIISKNNLKNSVLYQQGFFEFQDIGSQLIGHFLFENCLNKSNLNELKIIDTCAGAGGKTLHLSALYNNLEKIYATDYVAMRLKNLALRAKNAGCKNIEIIDFNESKKIKNANIILIDAPCSGIGTLKRQADLKYKINAEKIKEYITIQAQLLETYQNNLVKSGKIIYATCSILPQENELQIEAFLEKNKNFKLVASTQLLPTHYPGDGFYMACLERIS